MVKKVAGDEIPRHGINPPFINGWDKVGIQQLVHGAVEPETEACLLVHFNIDPQNQRKVSGVQKGGQMAQGNLPLVAVPRRIIHIGPDEAAGAYACASLDPVILLDRVEPIVEDHQGIDGCIVQDHLPPLVVGLGKAFRLAAPLVVGEFGMKFQFGNDVSDTPESGVDPHFVVTLHVVPVDLGKIQPGKNPRTETEGLGIGSRWNSRGNQE